MEAFRVFFKIKFQKLDYRFNILASKQSETGGQKNT